MAYVLTNLHWFALLIGALVFFHELGHFLVAKACGVKVLRFCLGFGPRLLSITRGETEYQLSLLPLGGYVKMLGDVPGAEVPPEEAARAFSSRPVWQRAAIVVAGPVFNLTLATVVYFVMFVGAHSFGDTRLGVVTQNEPAWNAGLRPGDKVVAVQGHPVDRWDGLRDAIAERPGASLALTYEHAGVRHDVTLQTQTRDQENAFQEVESRGKIGVSLQFLRPVLAIVDGDSPAAQAGARSGDVVVQVGATAVTAWHEVRDLLAAAPAGPLALTVRRDGKLVPLTLTPAGAPPAGLDGALFSAADAAGGYTGLTNMDAVVARVEADTPAQSVGLQPGDRLLGLTLVAPDGTRVLRPIGVWGIDLAPFGLDARSELVLTYQRGRTVISRAFHLLERREKDEMRNEHTAYVFGATNDPDVLDTYTYERPVGAPEALAEALHQVGEDMTLIGRGLGKMVRGSIPLSTMGGPIMLFVIAEKSAKKGWAYFGRTLAVISVNLALLNLLPIPVLDGGQLMWCVVEAVSRRPPSLRLREVANMVGLSMLLLMMVLVFKNDLLRFIVP